MERDAGCYFFSETYHSGGGYDKGIYPKISHFGYMFFVESDLGVKGKSVDGGVHFFSECMRVPYPLHKSIVVKFPSGAISKRKMGNPAVYRIGTEVERYLEFVEIPCGGEEFDFFLQRLVCP